MLNSIVDLSHFNTVSDLAAAKNSGIMGVIHKATQGTGFTDPHYARIRQAVKDLDLLFGAYHFGTGDDPAAQADHFLQVAQPNPDDLLVLDLETNPQGPSMTLDQARAFVTRVQQATGRWPGLYAGYYLKQLLGAAPDAVLSNCWFWISQYGPTPVIPQAWSSWTMWQYTDGAAGPEPHQVPGIGRCDRDMFNGTSDQMVAFWKAAPLPAATGVSA